MGLGSEVASGIQGQRLGRGSRGWSLPEAEAVCCLQTLFWLQKQSKCEHLWSEFTPDFLDQCVTRLGLSDI